MIQQMSIDTISEKWKNGEPIRIIGIDTGLANVGWGVIESINNQPKLIASGVITTTAEQDLPERLYIIKSELESIINTYNPHLMAYEELFYHQNRPNMMKTNLPVGVIITVGYEKGLRPIKFRPQDPKYLIAEKNNASKEEVAQAVALHLGILPIKFKDIPDHITDALGHALCYLALINKERLDRLSPEKENKKQKKKRTKK